MVFHWSGFYIGNKKNLLCKIAGFFDLPIKSAKEIVST
ncbi:MAG: hypothetical protein ACJAY0_001810 [Thalassolituus sp.]|jgi:hypothetical protein|tara:strand:+ start:12177 stop:12290 length:114 start_codon:yes stop_codon:yes gene_type:complete